MVGRTDGRMVSDQTGRRTPVTTVQHRLTYIYTDGQIQRHIMKKKKSSFKYMYSLSLTMFVYICMNNYKLLKMP